MTDVTIRVDKLSKLYHIGRAQQRQDTLRDAISSWARPKRRMHNIGSRSENLWALRNISFEVSRGEVLGVVGRNGAGKSTLLKILSRITEPTEGWAEIHGRVGSLLEVGTGFHPELTGRENIYLNGAILGMRRHEIERKFDEIVAFADIERFLDTPVKRYSSGMYVRLAFAVAAHLEPEVLLVDEVLAVGDAAFQRKCLGKMGDVAHQGRTVLFVSHNMAAVQALCGRCILIEGGGLKAIGGAFEVIREYLTQHEMEARTDQLSTDSVLQYVETRDASGSPADAFEVDEPITIVLHLDTHEQEIRTPSIGLGFNTALGERVFTVGTYFSSDVIDLINGQVCVICDIPNPSLAPGDYYIKVALGHSYRENFLEIEHAGQVRIRPSDFFGTGRLPSTSQGKVVIRSKWRVIR